MARSWQDEAEEAPPAGHWTEEAEPVQAVSGSAATPTLDALGTGSAHFVRHATAGLGDKLTAAIMAARDVAADRSGKANLSDSYRRNLAFLDKTLEASDAAHPVARWVGNAAGLAGNLAILAAAAPAQAAGAAPTLAQLAGRGAATGAIMGGLGGFGADRSDSTLGTLANTGAGIGLGALVGGAAPFVGRGLQAGANRIQDLAGWLKVNSIHPTPTLGEEMADIPGGVPAVGRALLDRGIGGATKAGTAHQVDAAFEGARRVADNLAAAHDAAGGAVDLASAFGPAQARARQLLNSPATADAGRRLQALLDEYGARYGAGGNPSTATSTATEALMEKRNLGRLGYDRDTDYAAGVRLLERGVHGALTRALGTEYEAANVLVRQLHASQDAATRGAARTAGNHILGLLPFLGALGGAGVGHAEGAATPMALAYGLGTLLAGKYGAQAGARTLYSPVAGMAGALGAGLERAPGGLSAPAGQGGSGLIDFLRRPADSGANP